MFMAEPAPLRRALFRSVGVVFFIMATLVGFELLCRVYAAYVVFPELEKARLAPLHFYQKSDNAVLGYELRPHFELEHEGRKLHINRYGLRESDDDLAPHHRRIALLGDSVLFAVGLSQENTLGARIQDNLDAEGDAVRVLNFGVPGYAFAQVEENLRVKNEIYDVSDAVYLLNLNDYSRRNSIYEGADNGLYRTYHRPSLLAPWFIRKAIYRYAKGSQWGDADWYRWFFDGNEAYGYASLDRMIDYARSQGIAFSVVLVPAGAAYIDDEYVLADLHDQIEAYLVDRGIRVLNPVNEFLLSREDLIDETDHLHQPGIDLMGNLVAEFIEQGGKL